MYILQENTGLNMTGINFCVKILSQGTRKEGQIQILRSARGKLTALKKWKLVLKPAWFKLRTAFLPFLKDIFEWKVVWRTFKCFKNYLVFSLKYVTVDLFCFQSSGIGGISFIARICETHLEFCLLLDTNFEFWHVTYSVPAKFWIDHVLQS